MEVRAFREFSVEEDLTGVVMNSNHCAPQTQRRDPCTPQRKMKSKYNRLGHAAQKAEDEDGQHYTGCPVACGWLLACRVRQEDLRQNNNMIFEQHFQ